MSRKTTKRSPRELESLIQYLQKKYADAYQRDDLGGLIEYSGGLSVAYSSIDCPALAEKWMDEYVSNLERVDPLIKTRIETIRQLLPHG